jgi:predicted secreted hydrolase
MRWRWARKLGGGGAGVRALSRWRAGLTAAGAALGLAAARVAVRLVALDRCVLSAAFGLAARAFTLGGVLVGSALAAGPLPDVGVLGEGADSGFAQVLGPRGLEFPRDHGAHPDYRLEWWYVTGNLDAADGERFGFELTFFRFALAPEVAGRASPVAAPDVAAGSAPVAAVTAPAAAPTPGAAAGATPAAAEGAESRWRTRQIYMGHFAITDVARQRFRFTQKLSRGAVGLAGAENPPLHVWVDDWSLAATSPDDTHWKMRASEGGYELALDAQALMQPVLNGDQGFSRKADQPGAASYYYSIPRVAVQGKLTRDGKSLDVHGLAWMDREWTSGLLSLGWDWFALQMDDGSSFMFYALRQEGGQRDPVNSAGTWTSPSGQSRRLSSDEVQIDVLDYWTNPRGERYPGRWRVRVPAVGIDVEVRPALANQELTTSTRYWEGAVDVTAASGEGGGAKGASGRGYVELVGYAGR